MFVVFSVLVIAYAKGGLKLSFFRKRRNEKARMGFGCRFLLCKPDLLFELFKAYK
jgi:hypothetical protein